MTPVAPHPDTQAAPAPGALGLAAAFDRVCGGTESFPIEIAGSREFVSIPLTGPKGKESVRFGIDTGGNTAGLMLDRGTATRLGFASEADLPKSIHLGDRDVPLPAGASWILADDAMGARARKGFSRGQIGAGFLSRFLVCIDPKRGRMGLADPSAVAIDASAAKSAVPLVMQPGGKNNALYPFLYGVIATATQPVAGYGFLLDTGATTSMLDAKKIDHLKHKVPAFGLAHGAAGDADMIGGQFSEPMLRVDKLVLDAAGAKAPLTTGKDMGGATFVGRPSGVWTEMFGDIPGLEARGAIANDVLLRFAIIVDYKNAKLYAEPSPAPPSPSSSMVRVGIAFEFGDDGCPIVRQVTDTNAPRTIAWLKMGDVITAIDGQDVCKLQHHEIQALLAGTAGAEKKLNAKRGAAPVETNVPVADLFARTP